MFVVQTFQKPHNWFWVAKLYKVKNLNPPCYLQYRRVDTPVRLSALHQILGSLHFVLRWCRKRQLNEILLPWSLQEIQNLTVF